MYAMPGNSGDLQCDDGKKRHIPPLSLLLSGYGSSEGRELDTSYTPKQWLWFLYVTSWARPFFTYASSGGASEATEGSSDNRSGSAYWGRLSFDELLKLSGSPIPPAMVSLWMGLCMPTDDVVQELRIMTEGKAEGRQRIYPFLPRVAESTFGRALRSLAVRQHISSWMPSHAGDVCAALDVLVRDTLEVIQNSADVRKTARVRCEERDASGEEALEGAFRSMLSASTTAPKVVEATTYRPLFDVKASIPEGGTAQVLIRVANAARLFAALSVEAFGRVKSECAVLLLAHINQRDAPEHVDARAYGVVTGVVEYAMAYRYCRDDGTGRCPLTCAALLLHRLVELQGIVEKDTAAGDRCMGMAVSASRFANMTVACIQELLFCVVAGDTVRWHREHQPDGVSVCPTAARTLTLHETDCLLQVFIPALLQQVGFEWPWSESLRHAKMLDRARTQHIVMEDGVRLDSRSVFEELLVSVARRTYGLRLRAILPQSFDVIAENIFVSIHDVPNEGKSSGGNPEKVADNSSSRFALPLYYRTAGEVLLEYFDRCGPSGITAEETERVLRRATDVQPMVVQLQALGGDTNGGITDCVSYCGELSRTVYFSAREKERLLQRYRCEVLLASLVVYTQLRTVSVVQQLTRQLAPLFEQLLLPLAHERTLSRCPVIASRKGDGVDDNGTPLVDLTPEFKMLVDEIHYEFYPLEWVPEAVDAHIRQECGVREKEGAPYHEGGNGPPCFAQYSLFAAIAHQFGLVLEGNPRGFRGGDGSSSEVRTKAYRFFTLMLLNNLGDAVSSSCELDGAAALAATRRVKDCQDGSENCKQRQAAVRQRGGASFHSVVSACDVVVTMTQCLLPAHLSSHPRMATTGSMSNEWMRRVGEWTRSAYSKYTAYQQQVHGLDLPVPLISLYNSLTFDSVPLARETIRAVRSRLLEKMSVVTASPPGDVETAGKQLLEQHLSSLTVTLTAVGLLPLCVRGGSHVPCATQLLWASPFFSHELLHCGRYEVSV
ncbi:hypothetical protein, conserved [Trypanosoma brucei brucei TREU927]|uniref:Nuclear cap binding complex subunit CBP110 n=1 Tax=Trypanosoma brucei brucei (strain 927/4 GUTat10.1) TaxID=185431 RepID=Q38BU6_TRYB2|nr:hypothetical protein, conserved [Trypanosoma brucei brucei TREU927]EAN77724.1 hypothetical protein, conserved [Trypanosoma brucei brucei TREU927]